MNHSENLRRNTNPKWNPKDTSNDTLKKTPNETLKKPQQFQNETLKKL